MGVAPPPPQESTRSTGPPLNTIPHFATDVQHEQHVPVGQAIPAISPEKSDLIVRMVKRGLPPNEVAAIAEIPEALVLALAAAAAPQSQPQAANPQTPEGSAAA